MSISISYNNTTHALSLLEEGARDFPGIADQLRQLNILTAEIAPLGAKVPPVPTPQTFDKDKSKMIMKLYESGLKAFQAAKYHEAAKQFTVALEIVMRRVKFDLCQGTFAELALLLTGRADSYLKTGEYVAAFNDADMLVGMMMVNPDNLLRRGVANFFLKRYEDALADFNRGLAFDESHERLKAEVELCKKAILAEKGDRP